MNKYEVFQTVCNEEMEKHTNNRDGYHEMLEDDKTRDERL